MTEETLQPWPQVDAVAAYLRAPLAVFSPDDQALLAAALAAAQSEARVVPDWRTADLVPARVSAAVVELAGENFKLSTRTASVADLDSASESFGSIRYRCLTQMGRFRGGRPVAR